MLKFDKVSFFYENEALFRDFCIEISENEVTGVLGHSGCGKTTLMELSCGMLKPFSGNITPFSSSRPSFVFQEDRLCEEFSAVSNVRLVAHKSFSKADAENLLSLLGIDDFKKKVHDFSGGMKRRVAIARAIAADCDVILLDEAFKGLDADTRKNVIDVFRRYTEGKTIIAVTHDYEEAVLMNAGIVKL